MKAFDQTEWQGISFVSFSKTSTIKVAGFDFYNAFYQALFNRYKSYEQLTGWRGNPPYQKVDINLLCYELLCIC